jgi:hypothetical protein
MRRIIAWTVVLAVLFLVASLAMLGAPTNA